MVTNKECYGDIAEDAFSDKPIDRNLLQPLAKISGRESRRLKNLINKENDMNKLSQQEHELAFQHLITTHPDTCGKCFCNDLCIFLLMETGVATTCKDFKARVKRIVERESEHI